MGGGHDHHAKIRIPDYKIYKTENVPELMAVQRALASRGLKDPWLRNEVWKYDLAQRGGTTRQIFRRTFGRGMFWGFVAAVITTGLEKIWQSRQPHPHGHDEHH